MPDSNTPPKSTTESEQVTQERASELVPAETGVSSTVLEVDDTAGTGTAIALGCIGATLFLILLGLIFIGVTQLIG